MIIFQFGFFGGTGLSGSEKLLQGSGKHVKHVKVYTLGDIDEAAFRRLIQQACKHESGSEGRLRGSA